jgi:predicted nucleic acid-binding protein
MKRPPLISSLSMNFRKATRVIEDHEEAKLEHRQHLRELVEDYRDKVANGEADGIRNAKDLIEVMKMDLLLMGEVTDRTETNTLDDTKVVRVTQLIDDNDPMVQSLMDEMLKALNGANDEADDSPNRRPVVEQDEPDEEE